MDHPRSARGSAQAHSLRLRPVRQIAIISAIACEMLSPASGRTSIHSGSRFTITPAYLRTVGCIAVCGLVTVRRTPTISACNDALRPGLVLRIRQACLTVFRHFPIPFSYSVLSNGAYVPLFRHPPIGMAIATEEMRRGQPTSRGGRVCYRTRHRQTPCAPNS